MYDLDTICTVNDTQKPAHGLLVGVKYQAYLDNNDNDETSPEIDAFKE